jgi:hypothetical protein
MPSPTKVCSFSSLTCEAEGTIPFRKVGKQYPVLRRHTPEERSLNHTAVKISTNLNTRNRKKTRIKSVVLTMEQLQSVSLDHNNNCTQCS